nr:importin-9 isoform X1 [Ipomoea batatas]
MLDGHTQNISEARGDGMYCFLCDIIGVVPMARMIALMPFLYARMFSSIAKFSSVINQGIIQQFLYAAVKAIGMDVYITRLIRFSLLTFYLLASDETMHLVLETLQATVNAEISLDTQTTFIGLAGLMKGAVKRKIFAWVLGKIKGGTLARFSCGSISFVVTNKAIVDPVA